MKIGHGTQFHNSIFPFSYEQSYNKEKTSAEN